MTNKFRRPFRVSSWLRTLINLRTLIILVLSVISCYITIHYQIRFVRSTLLFTLIISFPLFFTIQEAFTRRERGLEYLSSFRASIEVTFQAFYHIKKLSDESRIEIHKRLKAIPTALLSYLRLRQSSPQQFYERMNDAFLFMQEHRQEISTSSTLRIFRHMEHAYESGLSLISLSRHGTVVGIRSMALLGVIFFPLMEAPILFGIFEKTFPVWVVYALCGLSSFVLIIFYTIQRQIENPFDQIGLDDILLDDFELSVVTHPEMMRPLMPLKKKEKDIEEAEED